VRATPVTDMMKMTVPASAPTARWIQKMTERKLFIGLDVETWSQLLQDPIAD
jgi:hypothetical protein